MYLERDKCGEHRARDPRSQPLPAHLLTTKMTPASVFARSRPLQICDAEGEAKISPDTAAVSMPRPMRPAWPGS